MNRRSDAFENPPDGPDGPRVEPYAEAAVRDAAHRFKEMSGQELSAAASDAALSGPRTEWDPGRRQRLMEMMEGAGFRPEHVHAYVRTGGLLPTAENLHLLNERDVRRWRSSVEEYFEWQRLGDEAEAEGLIPAVVFAIRRSGILLHPSALRIDAEGRVCVTNEQEALFMHAYADFNRRNPEQATPQFLDAWESRKRTGRVQ